LELLTDDCLDLVTMVNMKKNNGTNPFLSPTYCLPLRR